MDDNTAKALNGMVQMMGQMIGLIKDIKGGDKGKGYDLKGKGKGSIDRKRKGPGETPLFRKAMLNDAVQKIVAGNGDFQKGSIAYSTKNVIGGKQSQVKISCLPNYMADHCFAGHPCPTENESIESAAEVALQVIMEDAELKELHDRQANDGAEGQSSKKRKREKYSGEGTLENKARLNAAVAKITKPTAGTMTRGMVKYATHNVAGGKQTEVRIESLPNAMAEQVFVGDVFSSEKLAMNSAAGIAYDAIMDDEELKELHDQVKPPKLGDDGEPLPSRNALKKQLKKEAKQAKEEEQGEGKDVEH
eukprot:gnl/MRDRNA2_/MRDRNA2_106946_c0_seq1.p1 gnl/MRDRNA2_/MRDRNA2_106946_c0~~gnl/MRDRNA2_/MRDRNA2_106946_c0_seq1.p1  ORF type:complete len:338 (-),score=90.62 gnl/MRDRNA2_/MRDRNA2_106946_c0_seq1:37-951(-)